MCFSMVGQHNKMSTFLVVFAALLAAVSAAITQDHLRGAIHACYPKITTGPPGSFEAFLQSKKIPSTNEEKCFIGCFYRKIGLIKNEGLDLKVALELADAKYKNPSELKKAYKIADTCYALVKNIQDECHLGYMIRKCFIVNSDDRIRPPFLNA
ncbi:uncharacterized protein LOC124368355 [Homalodisca vitripennis]|uniref:uncharacterized protein LOC124368355 n=1 Tax=Homalodisca vitripennis TaxID=197043 RepID=UPI001EEB691C|nr:uncharacterized protein LOC124368355 [Homalodisca vitripennis]